MKQGEDWPRDWTAQIGKAVARHRKIKGLSAQALSDKCAELGFPIARNTIANLENGRKESIPIHEVAMLAHALGVRPVDLLFPAATDSVSWVTPGGRPIAEAGEWFGGMDWFYKPIGPDDASEYALIRSYEDFVDALPRAASLDDVPDRDSLERQEAAAQVRYLRMVLEDRSIPLPDLPEDVARALEQAREERVRSVRKARSDG